LEKTYLETHIDMRSFLLFFASFVGYYAAAQSPAAPAHIAVQPVEWPHHKKAAIVLTYDDGLLSQLNNAVPQLQRAGFKATFFLTSDLDSSTIPRWRALAKKGFELANHTLYHPCAPSEDNPVSSEHYTAYQVIREIEIMNRILFAIDGKNGRTYAYPCAETTLGGKDYVDSLRRYGMVKYARVGGDTGAVITDFNHLDLLRIPSLGLEDSTSAATLIAYIKKVEQSGGMGIIMFHGIGGDYITTSSTVHQQLLDYLQKNKNTLWITTFQQAMDYVTHLRWRS
jgi:peptidoglycan/xylan/chitin deacetylase (PgdA/CDA1 family)